MVPYRAFAGFFDKAEEVADWGSVKRMIAYIERINRDIVLLPYTKSKNKKLAKSDVGPDMDYNEDEDDYLSSIPTDEDDDMDIPEFDDDEVEEEDDEE